MLFRRSWRANWPLRSFQACESRSFPLRRRNRNGYCSTCLVIGKEMCACCTKQHFAINCKTRCANLARLWLLFAVTGGLYLGEPQRSSVGNSVAERKIRRPGFQVTSQVFRMPLAGQQEKF